MSMSLSMAGPSMHHQGDMLAAGAPTGQGGMPTGPAFRWGGSTGSRCPGGPAKPNEMFTSSLRHKHLCHSLSAPSLENMPDPRRAIGVSEVAPRWLSASGCGGFHFPARHDDHQHGLRESRHEAAESVKAIQRRTLQSDHASIPLLEHRLEPRWLNDKEAAHKTYDINGRVYCQSKIVTPMPEQNGKVHWVAQTNGIGADYNIISNTFTHPHLKAHRERDVATMRSAAEGQFDPRRGGRAGTIQPQRPVASFDTPNFIPIKPRDFQGVAERHGSLFS